MKGHYKYDLYGECIGRYMREERCPAPRPTEEKKTRIVWIRDNIYWSVEVKPGMTEEDIRAEAFRARAESEERRKADEQRKDDKKDL